MSAPHGLPLQDDPDIVRAILERVTPLVPQEQREQLERVEEEVRDQYGGQRVRIPKRNKARRAELMDQAYEEGKTNATTDAVTAKYGISRRTLYRLLKNGPPKK